MGVSRTGKNECGGFNPSFATLPRATLSSCDRTHRTRTVYSVTYMRDVLAPPGDAFHQRLQQPLPTRYHRRGLPCDGHNIGLQPPAGDTATSSSLPRAHPAHANMQDRAACPDGTVRGRHTLPGGEPLYGLS